MAKCECCGQELPLSSRDRQEDMRRVADLVMENLEYDNCEYGGLGLDPKRPFGNSDVEGDILEHLGIEPPAEDDFPEWYREYARKLYFDMAEWLRNEWKRLNGKA